MYDRGLKVIHLRLHGSPWSALHGGHCPGRCRQPGEPGFPPACASAAVTGCNWGCSTLSPPPAGAQQGVTGRFIRTGPGRGHAHRPFGPSPASGAGSVAAAPAAPAVAAGKGRAPASPRANRSRSTAAVRTRPGPGPSGTAPQATGMVCAAAPGRYSSSTTSRRKTGAC